MEDILNILLSNDLYGAGKCTEIAKGKYEKVTTFREAKEKIKRIWLSRK